MEWNHRPRPLHHFPDSMLVHTRVLDNGMCITLQTHQGGLNKSLPQFSLLLGQVMLQLGMLDDHFISVISQHAIAWIRGFRSLGSSFALILARIKQDELPLLKFSRSTCSLLTLPGMKLNPIVLMVAALPLLCILLPHHPDLQSANSTDIGSDFGTMQSQYILKSI